jgi:hypothetical protein
MLSALICFGVTPYFFSFRSPDTLLINPTSVPEYFSDMCDFDCLFLGIWDKGAHVLLSSCLRCSLQAYGVGFMFIISFVWLYLAVGEIQRVRPSYLKGVSFWRPLWIAYVEIIQKVPSVFVQYSMMMKVLMTGRNYDCVDSREGESESAEDSRSYNCCNEMDAT